MNPPSSRRAALLAAAALALAPASRIIAPGALVAQAAPARTPAAAPAPAREEFDDFFRRFDQDSAFQLSRIRFPLPWFSQADDSTSHIGRRKWEFVSLMDGRETTTQLFDSFGMKLRDSDERVFAITGTGSDIRQNYYFRRLRGKWYLVRVEDLSM